MPDSICADIIYLLSTWISIITAFYKAFRQPWLTSFHRVVSTGWIIGIVLDCIVYSVYTEYTRLAPRLWAFVLQEWKLRVNSRSLPSDFCVRIWNNDSGELLAVMAEQSGQTVHASFSPNSARILSAAWDGAARVWDAESGVCLLSFQSPDRAPPTAVFSPDGRYTATVYDDRNVQVWRGEDKVRLGIVVEHTKTVSRLVFSLDGRTLASGDRDGIVHMGDIGGLVQHWCFLVFRFPL